MFCPRDVDEVKGERAREWMGGINVKQTMCSCVDSTSLVVDGLLWTVW